MAADFSFDLNALRARDEINDALGQPQRVGQAMPQPPGVMQQLGQYMNVQANPQMQQVGVNIPMGGGVGFNAQQRMQPGMAPQQQVGVSMNRPGFQAGLNVMGQRGRFGMPNNVGVRANARVPFEEGGLATSLRDNPIQHERDVAMVDTRNRHLREMVGKQNLAAGGGAWTRKEGKNPEGGLNALGRASLKAEGHDIKPPVSAKQAKKSPKAAARRKSFCARMSGMPGAMKDDNGKPTRKALALRKWDCKAEGGAVGKPIWDEDRPEDLGKPKKLSVKKKAFAKRRAEAAGRPYPNLVDNLAAARKKGK